MPAASCEIRECLGKPSTTSTDGSVGSPLRYCQMVSTDSRDSVARATGVGQNEACFSAALVRMTEEVKGRRGAGPRESPRVAVKLQVRDASGRLARRGGPPRNVEN